MESLVEKLAEQVVSLGAYSDFSDGSSAGSLSGIVDPLGDTCCDLEEFSSSAIKLIER